MLWQKLNDISTNYVFGGTRYDVYDTDCSGIVCGACYKWLGIDPLELGWWTGGMWVSPLLDIIWQGESPELPWEIMKEDDFIFTSTTSIYFDSFNGSHVGLYTGIMEMPFLSHFANGGPFITQVNGVYNGNERYYGVARLKELNMDEVLEKLEELKNYLPAWMWEYNWEQTAPFGNMYNCLVNTCNFVMDVKRQLERVEEKVDLLIRSEDDGR